MKAWRSILVVVTLDVYWLQRKASLIRSCFLYRRVLAINFKVISLCTNNSFSIKRLDLAHRILHEHTVMRSKFIRNLTRTMWLLVENLYFLLRLNIACSLALSLRWSLYMLLNVLAIIILTLLTYCLPWLGMAIALRKLAQFHFSWIFINLSWVLAGGLICLSHANTHPVVGNIWRLLVKSGIACFKFLCRLRWIYLFNRFNWLCSRFHNANMSLFIHQLDLALETIVEINRPSFSLSGCLALQCIVWVSRFVKWRNEGSRVCFNWGFIEVCFVRCGNPWINRYRLLFEPFIFNFFRFWYSSRWILRVLAELWSLFDNHSSLHSTFSYDAHRIMWGRSGFFLWNRGHLCTDLVWLWL